MKFRKKPVEVEAFQITREWLDAIEKYHLKDGVYPQSDYVIVKTLEGNMRGEIGDWIIKGVAGELYPCKPDIFKKTYEPVQPPLPK